MKGCASRWGKSSVGQRLCRVGYQFQNCHLVKIAEASLVRTSLLVSESCQPPPTPPGAGTARSVLVARLREVGHCRRPVAFSRDEEVFPREGAALSAGRLRYMNHHLKMARRLVTSGGMAP